MTNQQPQHFNKRLSINNEASDINAIICKLSKAENLQPKKLSLTNIKAGTVCVSAISNLLSNLKHSLKTLSIHSKFMYAADTQTIADCITSDNTALIKLELAGNNYSWTTIINSVRSSSLQKLSLREQCVDAGTALAINGVMQRQCLTKLSFVQCTFQEGVVGLIMAGIKVSAVTTLILEEISFDQAEIEVILNCIENSKLTKLSLCWSRGRFDVADHALTTGSTIVDAIKQSSLVTLNGRKSSFFSDAETIIAIIKFTPLTKFKFDQNRFSIEDSMAIIDAIKDRPDFKIMPVSGIRFTNETLTKVCDLLKSGTGLTQLDLTGWYLTIECLIIIIDSIKESSITSINFGSTYINREATDAICDLLENCIIKKIKFVGLGNSTIDPMMSSIKKSTLIKFKMRNWGSVREDTRIKIEKILSVNRNILNRSYTTKSARL